MINVTKKEKLIKKQISWDLSFTGLLIFLLFRIPLTNIIGNEGNGYYFVSFEIFTLFYLIFGFCFHQITYELFRRNLKKYSVNTKNTLFTLILVIGILASFMGACGLFIASNRILSFLHTELAIISLRLLCLWLIISTVSGIFRGYFEGNGSRIPTSFSKIIEAIVAGTGALIFASSLDKYGTKVGDLLFNSQYQPAFGATGIVCGFLCGGLFSFVFLFLIYHFFKQYQKQNNHDTFAKEVTKRKMLMDIFKMYFLCLIGVLCMYSYRVVNLFLYISSLTTQVKEEATEINILSLIGSYHGKVLILIGIAILIILSLCGKNIPKIKKYYSKSAFSNCWKYVFDDIKQICYISIPTCILYVVLSENLLNLIYGKANLTEVNYLKIESICIIFIPLAIYLYRLIQKLNLSIILFILPMIAFIGQSIVMYVLVSNTTTRILSIVISEVIFWFLLFIFELLIIMKEFKQISSN